MMETPDRAIADSAVCNICGAPIEQIGADREAADCISCGSNRRVRSLIALLTQEMFGLAMSLPDLPALKEIRGIGMSDSPQLAAALSRKFDYTNTFYHQAPLFDVTNPDERDRGRYDFILTSEVMEHVPPPVEKSFEALAALLKPNGLLLMTVPFILDGKTREHFSELHEYTLAKLGERIVLLNRRRDGSTEIFEDLCFHGGPGSTLEMRLFTQESLREALLGAGFRSVYVSNEDRPEFGILHTEPYSLPIVARKQPFHAPVAPFARAYREAARLSANAYREYDNLKRDYERFVEFHNSSHAETQQQIQHLNSRIQELESTLPHRAARAFGIHRKPEK